MSLFPIGEALADAMARRGHPFWLMGFAFALGFGSTVAEPALAAVAAQAASAMVADPDFPASEAQLAALTVQIRYGATAALIEPTLAATADRVRDLSGGTVPIIAAYGVAVAETLPGRSGLADGFGMIVLAMICSGISVLAAAILTEIIRRRASVARDTERGNS